jgi:TonB-linked SusC/RagA family outer membrane protein
MKKFLILFFLAFSMMQLWTDIVMAQKSKEIVLELKNERLPSVFKKLEKATHYKIMFITEDMNKFSVNGTIRAKDIGSAMQQIIGNKPLEYSIDRQFITVTLKTNTVRKVSNSSSSGSFKIHGRVVDSKGNPMPGVNVSIKRKHVGTTTDINGLYSISVDNGDKETVMFSFIGMKTEIANVECRGKEKALNMTLNENSNELGEVVVTGYQTINKKAMAGSYSEVKAKDLTMTGTQTIESMLQGKIAGMTVINQNGQTGTRQKIRVRGTSTLVGNAEPVWVVDGIIQEDNLPFQSSTLSSMGDNIDMMRQYIGGSVSWLNPHDIEDITVLKDASATAIYGVKAANGVILITTKKGQYGRMSINYSANFSTSTRLNYNRLELMNSQDRMALSAEAIERGARIPNETIGYTGLALSYMRREITLDEFHARARELETMNTDWFKLLYRSPFSQSHSISFSGGTDKITYRSSFGYNDTKNTAKGNGQQSYTANLNLSMRFWDKLTINASLSGAHTKTTGFASGVDPYSYALSTSRVIPSYNSDGSLYYYDVNGRDYNIINELANSGNINNLNSINVNLSARYRITNDFCLSATFGGASSSSSAETWFTEHSNYIAAIRGYNFGEYDVLDEEYKNSPLPHGGMQGLSESRNLNYTARIQAEYNKQLGKHTLNFVAGAEIRSNKYDGHNGTYWGYMPDRGKTYADVPLTYGYNELNKNYARSTPSITDRVSNTMSYYMTGTYMFDERYALNVSVRGDASNRLGEKQRFLPVWSSGLRWNINEEHWMAHQKIVDNLALTADFGYQGNVAENIGPDLIARMQPLSDNGEYTMTWTQLPNSHLKWEKTMSVNVGLNFALFGNKLDGAFNWYFKKSTDIITNAKVPFENGTKTMKVNNGSMYNRGWDLTLSITPIRTKDFMWTFGTTFSGNSNQVNSVIPQTGKWEDVVSGNYNKKGYAVGSFWAFRFKGLDHDNGAPTFDMSRASLNAAETDATEYMVYVGTKEPTFTIGINTMLRWKRWSFPLNFYISRGNYTFLSSPYPNGYMMMSEFTNASTELNRRWRNPGDEAYTNIPSIPVGDNCRKLYPFQSTSNYIYPLDAWGYSDARVVNAWFIRFNDFTFTYNVPEKWLKGIAKSATISFSATNPIQIKSKDFKGRDPEVAMGAQPRSQDFSFGVNLSF